METIICDTSALLYWRTPPIARLLAAAPEDDDLLRHLVAPERLRALRANLAECSSVAPTAHGASRLTGAGKALSNAAELLATNFGGPVDVLAPNREARRPSETVRPRMWSDGVSPSDIEPVAANVWAARPELALRQVAVRATPVRTALLLAELIGSFSVYIAPAPMAEFLQELADGPGIPPYLRWRPSIDSNGKLTGLWQRPPLATPDLVARHLDEARTQRGAGTVRDALELARPGASSPFEVQAGMLLAPPSRHGGSALDGARHNERVVLSADAARIAQQSVCYCDLFWPRHADPRMRGVDVECQSAAHHFGTSSSAHDADRATALQMMGIEVIQLTYAQLADSAKFKLFSAFLAGKLGEEPHEPTKRELVARERLRQEVLVDWGTLPFV